jgi:hypothetical protein
MGVMFPAGVFSAIVEAELGLSNIERTIEQSSARVTLAQGPPAIGGRIRLNTRTIENRASRCIFLFFMVTPPLFALLYSPQHSIGHNRLSSLCAELTTMRTTTTV